MIPRARTGVNGEAGESPALSRNCNQWGENQLGARPTVIAIQVCHALRAKEAMDSSFIPSACCLRADFNQTEVHYKATTFLKTQPNQSRKISHFMDKQVRRSK